MKKCVLIVALLFYKSFSFAQIVEFNDISRRDFNGVFAIRDRRERIRVCGCMSLYLQTKT
jgi:hypothetical protein